MIDAVTDNRVLPLEGVHNFRDYGGYAVAGGGRVKRGVLWRSGEHGGASETDLTAIGALELATVFDLRGNGERANNPCRRPVGFAAEVVYHDELGRFDETLREVAVQRRESERNEARLERDVRLARKGVPAQGALARLPGTGDCHHRMPPGEAEQRWAQQAIDHDPSLAANGDICESNYQLAPLATTG